MSSICRSAGNYSSGDLFGAVESESESEGILGAVGVWVGVGKNVPTPTSIRNLN
jgi:hypothetical protein